MAILGPFDFKGGYSPGYDLANFPQKGYCTTMVNCRVKWGFMTPRWNQTQVQTGSSGIAGNNAKCYGLKAWFDTPNSVRAIVAEADSKLWIADATTYFPSSSTITFTDRTGTASATTLAATNGTFDSLNAILVGAGNSGAPFKVTAYNANAAPLGGSPPSADIVKQCNNFMFLARNLSSTTTQSRVYWSNVNDPETWTVTNVLDFNKNDGEPIMALGSIGTDLYIFKQTSIGRLSTVTITVSGAVTLGPLSTVIRGVGCCGPRALDNLPNGNIVFVGIDGHFYEFDGSTLVDLSRQPNPGMNAYDPGFLDSTYTNMGISSGNPDIYTIVKTVRGINEVWIGYDVTSRGVGVNGVVTFMYDFEQGIWQGNSSSSSTASSIQSYCFETLPIASPGTVDQLESSQFVIHGAASGFIFASGDYTKPYPQTDALGQSAVTFAIGTIVDLQTSEGPFIPRSICFETSYTQSTNPKLSAFNLYANFDTYTPSSSIYSSSGQLPVRVVVPITFKQDSIGTNIFPSKLSLLWTGTGTGSGTNYQILRLGKFWLSDEGIR